MTWSVIIISIKVVFRMMLQVHLWHIMFILFKIFIKKLIKILNTIIDACFVQDL